MTMLFQGKDGELRLYEKGSVFGADPSGTTHYLEVLFCEMDFSGPSSRPRTDETLVMNRGKFDSDAHYIESNDEPRYAPLNVSFSCKLADTVNSRILSDWLSGATLITNAAGGSTLLTTWDGTTTIDGNTLPVFRDGSKPSYRVEVLFDGDYDLGFRYEEVCFKHGEQSISESADGLTLSCNGMVYGDVTRITALTSGTSILAFI